MVRAREVTRKEEVAWLPLGGVKGGSRSLPPRSSAPASLPKPKPEARLSASLGTSYPARGRWDAGEERGSRRPAPERRGQPRGQWGLSRGECRLVHTHPLCPTVQPQAPRLELSSPAVPILTRADAARAPPAALPGASSRNPRRQGTAHGSLRAGARGRAARSPASPGRSPRRPSARNSPPRRLPRPAAARPARVPVPRRAAPRQLGRFHGPRRDGVAMVTGRRRGGGSALGEATVTCAGSTAKRRHSGGHRGYTAPHSRPELWQLRERRAEKVSGAGSAPGFPVSSLSLSTLSTPEPRRPLGVRPGLGPSSAPGTQGHLSQPSWAEMALYTLLESWQ